MKNEQIRNPDGILMDVDDAVEQWYDLTRPLEDLGFELMGFDPSVSFKGVSGKCFTISVSDLRIINNAIKK